MLNEEIMQLESMIATLELENRFMRERNERLEKEVEQLHQLLKDKVKYEAT